MTEWLTEARPYLILMHLLGVAVGAGSAFMSDAMFVSSVKDERFSPTELRFLRLGSRIVWLGIFMLVASGALLLAGDYARYLASERFLAKMSVVAVIIVNGIVFHQRHIPLIMRHADHHFPSSDEFVRNRPFILASGAISMLSWISTIVLGALPGISSPYHVIMAVYAGIVLAGVCAAVGLKDVILPHHHVRNGMREVARRVMRLIDGG